MKGLAPLYVAAQTTGIGLGWWLGEWRFHPGSDAADAVVALAFGANFAVAVGLLGVGFARVWREADS